MTALVLVVLPATAAAQLPHVDLSVSAGSGSSWTGRPQDQSGRPTLLHGSGFSGSTTRVGVGVRRELAPGWAARLHSRIGWQHLAGFASVDDTRRELSFRTLQLEFIVAVEWTPIQGRVVPLLAAAAGPRFGLWTSATEVRTGLPTAEPAPSVRTGTGLPVSFEAGVRTQLGQRLLDTVIFGSWNALYPSGTLERLRDYRSVSQPGAYRADADFDVGILATLWI